MKKFVAIILAALMVLSLSVAMAASSKTSEDTSSATTSTPAATEEAATAMSTGALSEAAQDLINAMDEAVKNGQEATSALADDVAAELGEGAVALDAAGLVVDGTEPVDATFGFATQLEEGKNYKALVSCFNADKSIAAQFVLPVVNENGKAKVQFTREVLEAMNAAASNSIVIFEVK